MRLFTRVALLVMVVAIDQCGNCRPDFIYAGFTLVLRLTGRFLRSLVFLPENAGQPLADIAGSRFGSGFIGLLRLVRKES